MITSSPLLSVVRKALYRICLPPGADDRLARLVVEAVLALELGGDRFAQRRDAEHRRIFGFAALDRRDRRLLDVVGRVEIGLADRQRDDVAALRFEIARLLRHRDGRGGLNAGKGVGDKGHDRMVPGARGVANAAHHSFSGAAATRVLRLGRRRHTARRGGLVAGSKTAGERIPQLHDRHVVGVAEVGRRV